MTLGTADIMDHSRGRRVRRICKTCKHWQYPPSDSFGVPPFPVGICRPTETKYGTDSEYGKQMPPNGAVAMDASGYHAALLTSEEFGCLRHEEKV